MASILIKGGRVIDPASGRDGIADVAIRDGLITAIDPRLPEADADDVLDADGCIVAPGLIDPHVHLREPGGEHKETIATGTAAAVAGGFTTVCCMPNTQPALDSAERVRDVAARAKATAACRVFPVCAATVGRRGETLTDVTSCVRAGAVGVSDDGDVVQSEAMMQRVLEASREAGVPFMQHCQDVGLTRGAAMNAGDLAMTLGLGGWPALAEERIIERDIRLNGPIGARYHVQHLSVAGGVHLVRRARAKGQPVTAEASPHHLLLTEAACAGYNTMAKMNPPLRTEQDREALAHGVAEGVVTVLATDHAPHTDDEKAAPFEEAPFGIIGLETALALYVRALVATGLLEWPRLIALMTIEPARLCGLDRLGLGSLRIGGPADVTVIDPRLEWTISRDSLAGRSRNTPFLGWSVRGKAVATLVGGVIRHREARAQSA